MKNKWYWYWQFTGWFIYGIAGFTITALYYQVTWGTILMQLFSTACMVLATHFERYIILKNAWSQRSLGFVLPRLIPLVIVLAVITNSLVTLYGIWVAGFIDLKEYTWSLFLIYCFQTFLFISLWTAVYLSIKYFRHFKQEEIQKWKLEAALKDAELIALKAQINPHFLFNALNNIRGLILEDQMKARTMVDNLAEMLRYSIQFNNYEKVTLEEELSVVRKYLDLESIHYEKRLKSTITADKTISHAKVPPMIVQLMAENAIKHGISQVKSGGSIDISIEKQGDLLVICVSNTGQLTSSEQSGIGIRNAVERIKLLFDQLPDFKLKQQEDKVVATLILPYHE